MFATRRWNVIPFVILRTFYLQLNRQWPSSWTVIFFISFDSPRMHLSPSASAALSCSDAKPNATSLSSYSSRKTPSPITAVTSPTSVSTPPPRPRQRSVRLRPHHPTRRKDHHSGRELADPSARRHEGPLALIEEASKIGPSNLTVGVDAAVSLADRLHPTHDGRRPRASGTQSTPRRALSSGRRRLMRLVNVGKKSQEADIPKEATSILY